MHYNGTAKEKKGTPFYHTWFFNSQCESTRCMVILQHEICFLRAFFDINEDCEKYILILASKQNPGIICFILI